MIEFLSPVSKSVIAHREVLPAGVLGKQIQIHSKEGRDSGFERCENSHSRN